jgi:hypothetical protein
MRIVLCATALALAAGLPSYATLVVCQWTPERILLAADSLTAKVHESGRIEPLTECKIHQQGDIFFVIAGINDDRVTRVDLVSLAAGAARSSRHLRGVVRAFENSAAAPVRRLWSDVALHRGVAARLATETDGRMSLSILFVSRKEHAVAIKEYSGGNNGALVEDQARFYGTQPGMRQDRGYLAVGVYAEAEAAAIRTRQFGGLEGVPFVNSFFEVELAHERKMAARNEAPRIGLPVCILQVMTGIASWANGQQGPCGQRPRRLS